MNSLYIILNPSEELPYIGMTKDMKLRKYQHTQKGKIKKKSKMVELYKHEDRIKIKMLEQLLIHHHSDNISNSSISISGRKFKLYKKSNKNLFPRLIKETNELINK